MQLRRHSASRLSVFLFFIIFLAILSGTFPQVLSAQSRSQRSIIIDTDAGSDDLMAIAFLFSRPDIRVEAVTIVNGEGHVQASGRNVLRLLELAGRREVPVFLGRDTPLSGDAQFPAPMRDSADELLGVTLPEARRKIESMSADEYLSKRLSDSARPVQVLAFGPLTNLAAAISRNPRAAHGIRQLVIMGGAIGVSGNLGDGGAFKTENTLAEWNMFVDPAAAKIVFASGAPIRLVPLDATQRVPIDMALFEQFQSHASSPLAHFVAQVLATNRESIHQGFYFAWDPLAAAAFANPAVATFRPMAIEISDKPEESGRTIQIKKRRSSVQVAIDADSLRFRDVFMTALGVR
jgi:inosine-uridine nucleoside N-ribohydrolase